MSSTIFAGYCACFRSCVDSTVTDTQRPKCKMNKCQRICFCTVGIVLLVFGFLITGFWWHIYNGKVLQQLPLSNGSASETFPLWTNNTVPLHFSIYMFNWTNPDLTIVNKEKPKLEQIGPYVYRLEVYRKNFVWNTNDSITYLTGQRFYFVPELSNGDPYSDIITSPNVILITIMRHFITLPTVLKVAIDELFEQEKINLYVKKTANELLFDGYDDRLLNWVKPFKKYIPSLQTLPDRFAWYLPKNRTMADIFNIYTGQRDLSKMGLLHARNYTTKLSAFGGLCGKVDGSPGDFWPVDITKRQNASLFISDFCSTFQLQKQGEHVVSDINGIKYEGEEVTFDNGTQYPEKSCYCPNNECKWRSGVRDVSSCVQAPVFLSFPHFYAADPSYLNAVLGLSPNKDLHAFYMTFQKDYGILLNGAARLQLNMHIAPISGFRMFKNVPDMLLPALWFEERINLPPSVLDKLHFSFTTVPLICSIVGLILVILGSVIVLSNLVLARLTDQTIPYINETL